MGTRREEFVFVHTTECKRREWFRRWESTRINSLKSIFTSTVTLYQNILPAVWEIKQPSHLRFAAPEGDRASGRLWGNQARFHLANIGSPQTAQLGPRLPYATGRGASPGEGAREGLLDPQHPHTTQGCKHWSWISWNPSKAHSRVCFRKSYGNSFPAHSHPQEGKWRIFLLEAALNLSVTYPLAWDPHSLLLWMSCSIFSALDIQYRTCKDNQMFPYPSLDKYQVLRQIHWIYWVLSNKNISENKNTERCFHKIVIFNLYQTPPPHFRSVSVLSF